jgi:hypothetical protein
MMNTGRRFGRHWYSHHQRIEPPTTPDEIYPSSEHIGLWLLQDYGLCEDA